MLKPNQYYTEQDSQYVTEDYSVPSNKCGSISVKFDIDGRHILLALIELIAYEYSMEKGYVVKIPKNITCKKVEKQIRNKYFYYGGGFLNNIEIGLDGADQAKLPHAVKIANKLFPDFMGVPNSIKFIREKD